MNALPPTPQTTVEQVFQDLPQASHIFIDFHTDCTGCRLARFCTLEEMASIYELDLRVFIETLLHYAQPHTDTPKE